MKKELDKIEMYTDGACSGNPGPGGFMTFPYCHTVASLIFRGTILRFGSAEKELSGGERSTTNNRMELTAVIEGFKALKRPCDVTLYTDSKYVADAITKGWAEGWKKKGWKKSDGKPALNSDLWDELLTLISKHSLNIVWLKGHAGHPENERCDSMAVRESHKFIK